ncbi:hypothetical protein LAB1_24320 [Roseibium sp. LAB1]
MKVTARISVRNPTRNTPLEAKKIRFLRDMKSSNGETVGNLGDARKAKLTFGSFFAMQQEKICPDCKTIDMPLDPRDQNGYICN